MTLQSSGSDVEATLASFSRLDLGIDEQSVAPPISRLPAEILSDIFVSVLVPEQHFTSDNDHYQLYLHPRGVSSAPPIAHVCRAWRRIVLSTHWLWNFLHMSIMQSVLDNVIPLPHELLERSGTLPVFLSVNFDPGIMIRSVNTITNGSATSQNNTSLHRIQGVDINCNRALYHQFKPWLQHISFTRLTLLDVAFKDPPDMGEDLFNRLTHLHLRCNTSLDADLFMSPEEGQAWINLVSLTLESETPELDLNALEASFPRLEELFVITENAFAIWTGGRPPPPAAEPFTHANLRVLGIYSPEPAFQSILFERMAFPRLRAVGVTAEKPEDTKCVQTLVDRSGCRLEWVSVISADGKEFGKRCKDEWALFREKSEIPRLELVRRWTEMSLFRDSKDRWYMY
ncbi:hypothetical protein CONPUDRAFT_163571 [Coniophora puteana RWD-64-598 SS2]|uniref:Uncharacterized protein n=1 Tax=Coniophora puteana (strain RWD-64-598) TaxID=741705 RepID=A0A5M3N055_CONPW|nr:uncharacterized protein CONPUDRAFT_163571 [Coniophora puteana RWD-64-598 SS2]EIW84434.1 hypothetical protein CONPUDRAFT_163571 [Coniophora puteana RWD-64-598 SS2]